MAKITKIKAKDSGKSPGTAVKSPEKAKVVKPPKDSAKKETAVRKPQKKPFILIRPFVYFGRYLKGSWSELRLVRWPTRKATWKLVFAIFIYTGLFIAVIMFLDALFTWLFNLIIG